MSATDPWTLTTEQANALFDILSHHETYREIESFKNADAVTGYGYPFKQVTKVMPATRSGTSTPFSGTPRSRTPAPLEESPTEEDQEEEEEQRISQSPILQTLLTRFILPLPWLRDLSRDFWCVRIQGLLARLAEAELSESYDKGTLGLRKTLATGVSVLVEMVGRGVVGGVERREQQQQQRKVEGENERREYRLADAEGLERAWEDMVQGVVYGDLVGEMFKHMVRTDDLEGHSAMMKAVAEYAIIHLATFLHHVFIVSPEGQYLLLLIQEVHNLIPYKMVKQTLRIGNVTTMTNAMIRLLLTKVSVGSITNWVGLTANADDGMNLLQRIISLVLSWDSAGFRKILDNIEKKAKKNDGPSEESLKAINSYVDATPRIIRSDSSSKTSIITTILQTANLPPTNHPLLCSNYLSALLSLRDRDALTAVLCRSQPDLLTQLIREALSAYEPLIRGVHSALDLRGCVEDIQSFVDDFVTAGGKDGRGSSVEGYVDLLMRNRGMVYRLVHTVAEKCPDVWGELEGWAEKAFREFATTTTTRMTAGSDEKREKKKEIHNRLETLFNTLKTSSKPAILQILNNHAAHLSFLKKQSQQRLQQVLLSSSLADNNDNAETRQKEEGPGVYLSRWGQLLDDTPISPEVDGRERYGVDVRRLLAVGKTGVVGVEGDEDEEEEEEGKGGRIGRVDVRVVIEELGEGFREMVREMDSTR